MTEVLRIIAAVVDTHRLTLYRDNGESIIIAQGDPRIRRLVEKVVPAIEQQKFCELTMDELSTTTHYNQTEKELKGFVKFFRTAKATLEELLAKFGHLDQEDDGLVAPVAAGQIPVKGPDGGYADGDSLQEKAPTKAQSAVNEIMANAKASPTSSPDFHKPMTDTDTVVAVLDNGKVIPGIELIDVQLQGLAAKLGNAVGVQRFFERVSSVPRNHSVQDLLTFMQKGELPIADDGSVLVYKRLESTSEAGVFVDCHSRKVKQRVGSHVFMDEKLVDANRRVDCSNGLHVARRDYLSSFSGDVTVLAKLAPEDVIAVPHSDARKLRAKGYHIIAQLSAEDARRVCSNQPMLDKVLLGNAVAGNHVGILETVEIRAAKGGDLKVTAVTEAVEIKLDESKQAESLDSLPTQDSESSQVDAAALAKKVVSDRKSSQQQAAEDLMVKVMAAKTQAEQIEAAKALVAFKKTAKKGWDKLGITAKEAARVIDIANGQSDLKLPEPPKAAPVAESKDWAPSKVINGVDTGTGTPRERIRNLLDNLTSVGKAEAILLIKKQAKKSWDALGVTADELEKVTKLAGK